MKKQIVLLAGVAAALSACNDVTFNPEGTWDFYQGGIKASATYLDASFNESADVSYEELTGSAPSLLGTIALTYNPTTHEVSGIGPATVVENGQAVLADTTSVSPAGVYNCEVTQYMRQVLAFNASGSTSELRSVFGFSFRDTSSVNNCTAALTTVKTAILGGTIPSILDMGIYTGVLKAVVIDQMRSYEVAEYYAGTNTGSEALGTSVQVLEFQTVGAGLQAHVTAVKEALIGGQGI